VTSALQSAPQRRKFSRDDVLRLGQSGSPWAFLPVAAQVLRVAPNDHALRVLAASNLASIGLGTPALELLASVPETDLAACDVGSLREQIERPADDRIDADHLIATCRANIETAARNDANRETIAVLSGAQPAWEAQLDQMQWHRASDGNIVRREAGSLDLAAWTGLGDHVGAARAFSEQYFATEKDTHGPLTIEGMDPPWILREALRVFARRADGYERRIRVVQADAMEMLDGLAQAGLTEALASGQIELFAGDRCRDVFEGRLMGLLEYRVRGPYVPLATLRTKIDPPLSHVIDEACRAQEVQHRALDGLLTARYAKRDRAWWRARYQDATTGGRPLRVLVTTCLYSTFVQHASRDLVGAVRRAGHEAHLLIEPDCATHLCSVGYLETILQHDPDMIVLINYTRQNMGSAFPASVPFVTWLQDAMPHLFDTRIGSAMGPFDFLAGHLLPELFSQFDYPLARLIPTPVVADAHKFHPGPVEDVLRREHECEIAFVSHHSETPAQMHERLRRECADEPRMVRAVDQLYDDVREAAAASGHAFMFMRLREMATRVLTREMGSDATDGNCARLLRMYCMPMADRMIRHETLAWAVQLAQLHGWRLHLYGRGWAQSDIFSDYAKGELAHGEALRASYQASVIHLHMSGHTLVHQRVMECALSGGLPLCRLVIDELGSYRGWAHQRAAMRCDPTGYNATWDVPEFAIAEHAELMCVAAQYQRLNLPFGDVGALSMERLRVTREEAPRDASRHNPAWLLGDLAETTFRSRDDLERLVTLAIQSPARRQNLIDGIAGRVRQETTHDALFNRIVNCVNDSFSEDRA
jgi:hypothetical protein